VGHRSSQSRDGRGRRIRVVGADPAAIVRTTRVYIACAHLNHDPTDNGPRNLAAFFQCCHMIHDDAEHRRRRWYNAFRRRPLSDLLAFLDEEADFRLSASGGVPPATQPSSSTASGNLL
jgi:hypothetical protein